jgi:hypothetical protein
MATCCPYLIDSKAHFGLSVFASLTGCGRRGGRQGAAPLNRLKSNHFNRLWEHEAAATISLSDMLREQIAHLNGQDLTRQKPFLIGKYLCFL